MRLAVDLGERLLPASEYGHSVRHSQSALRRAEGRDGDRLYREAGSCWWSSRL